MSDRKYRSPSEWKALIEEQLASGLTGVAFCNERGLVAKTFYKQRRQLGYPRGQSRSAQPGGFVRVQPAAAIASASSCAVSLHYHDSRLELSSKVSAVWVAELLRALS